MQRWSQDDSASEVSWCPRLCEAAPGVRILGMVSMVLLLGVVKVRMIGGGLVGASVQQLCRAPGSYVGRPSVHLPGHLPELDWSPGVCFGPHPPADLDGAFDWCGSLGEVRVRGMECGVCCHSGGFCDRSVMSLGGRRSLGCGSWLCRRRCRLHD